jgi:hypothetical protein
MPTATSKKSYAASLLALVDKYIDSGGKVPYSPKDIAKWAIENGHWDRHKVTAVSKCAHDISRALREDYYVDPKGRMVRARHSIMVPEATNSGRTVQRSWWNDHRAMDGDFAERSFKQRRMQIVGDCKQLKVDVDSYNDGHPDQKPIQLVLNFTYDVAEDSLGVQSRVRKPR